MKKTIYFLLFTFYSITVLGANLSIPLTLPSAKVLPKGVRKLNYKGVFVTGESKLNQSGQEVTLADPFFQSVTFQDMIDGLDDPIDKGSLIAKMADIDANNSDSIGQTTGQINLKATAHVMIFAWGLTDNFTLAAVVPFTQSSLNADTSIKHTNPDLFNRLMTGMESVPKDQKDVYEKLINPVKAKLEDYNYAPLKKEEATYLGDIKLIKKVKIFQNRNSTLTFGGELTLPTGKKADPNKLVNLPGGDGQTDFGANFTYDIDLFKYFIFSSQVGGIIQYEDNATVRVPEKSDSTLSPDVEDVERDLGDHYFAHVAIKYIHPLSISLALGYSLQYKEEDVYNGSKYSSERYSWMSKDTEQRMQSLIANISYDTVSLFRQKKFPAPLEVSLTHTRVTSGKNVVSDPLTTFDFSLFF